MEYGWDHFAFYVFIYIIESFVFELATDCSIY